MLRNRVESNRVSPDFSKYCTNYTTLNLVAHPCKAKIRQKMLSKWVNKLYNHSVIPSCQIKVIECLAHTHCMWKMRYHKYSA